MNILLHQKEQRPGLWNVNIQILNMFPQSKYLNNFGILSVFLCIPIISFCFQVTLFNSYVSQQKPRANSSTNI